jgi:tRNA threonylcarbamoyladenosine biosynthesis protein TsaB
MLIAFETSTDIGSVAVGRGPELMGEVVIGARSRHAEQLLPALDFILHSAGIDRGDIRGIVVGAGPGSFTGVRVAAATARGLAAGLDVPLYAYSSLAALALEAMADRPVWALFDARRGEVYAACYARSTGDVLTEIAAPRALLAADVRAAGPSDARFAGDGARRYADVLGIAPPPPVHPRASALLRLAAADPEAGSIRDIAGWEPSYLRDSGAERGVQG